MRGAQPPNLGSSAGDPDETDRVIRAVAGGDLSEEDFRDWIANRCG